MPLGTATGPPRDVRLVHRTPAYLRQRDTIPAIDPSLAAGGAGVCPGACAGGRGWPCHKKRNLRTKRREKRAPCALGAPQRARSGLSRTSSEQVKGLMPWASEGGVARTARGRPAGDKPARRRSERTTGAAVPRGSAPARASSRHGLSDGLGRGRRRGRSLRNAAQVFGTRAPDLSGPYSRHP